MKKKRSGHIYFTTTLPPELVEGIKNAAKKRRVQQKQIVISGVSEFLWPKEQDEEVLSRRLTRIEGAQKTLSEKLEIISETLALFVQVWFSNTYELPEGDKETASVQGERRFNTFLEALTRRLEDNAG